MARDRDWLRVCDVADLLGAHPDTIRRWADAGKLNARPFNARGDRRFARAEIERFALQRQGIIRQALYTRVSGTQGQESSLAAQEVELREATTNVVAVFNDRASGLNEKRRGLAKLRAAATRGEFDEVWVTHEDRLTRFGLDFLRAELAASGVHVRVLHEREQAEPQQELVDDFISLLASFSGRLYGQRSAASRKRLLEHAT